MKPKILHDEETETFTLVFCSGDLEIQVSLDEHRFKELQTSMFAKIIEVEHDVKVQ